MPLERCNNPVALRQAADDTPLLCDALHLAYVKFELVCNLLSRKLPTGIEDADVVVARFEPEAPVAWINVDLHVAIIMP